MKLSLSTSELSAANAVSLDQEMRWLMEVMSVRFNHYFGGDEKSQLLFPEPPDMRGEGSDYASLITQLGLQVPHRIVLMLSLLPHIQPALLDRFFIQNRDLARTYTEFGGWKGKTHAGFLPTCETAAFIIAGNNMQQRFQVFSLFDDEQVLLSKRLIQIERSDMNEPLMSAALTVTSECLNRLTTGVDHKPDYSSHFPAKRISTALQWSDLVLNPETRFEIDNIIAWLSNSTSLLQDWGLERSVKPGYRCLFYGPPGTGKTLTATLIGQKCHVDVYRIDLSMMVSKYIGETEKNLANLFDQAQDKNWVLFFDEADALFGTRTETSSSNDRHANQEVSYLLQRVEDFPGVVILATNLKANIDEAFARRFQSSVYFSIPDNEQRLLLWQGLFQDPGKLGSDVNFQAIADKYELAGGAMTNVARYAAICATRAKRPYITQQDLVAGIRKELIKEGRTV